MLVGYERSYNGRAAGMRTYGLVCMASTALTVSVGHAPLWYGGTTAHIQADSAHAIQGVITGIGFLCAGVIMKDGMRVRGLTTAASVWAVAATGVLLGVGFYAAALLLAVLCVGSMSLVHPLESRRENAEGISIRQKPLEMRLIPFTMRSIVQRASESSTREAVEGSGKPCPPPSLPAPRTNRIPVASPSAAQQPLCGDRSVTRSVWQ